MVVVLVVIARAASPARVAEAVFRENGWAANMGCDCTGCAARWQRFADAIVYIAACAFR